MVGMVIAEVISTEELLEKNKQLQAKELIIAPNTRDILLVWNLWKEHRRQSVLWRRFQRSVRGGRKESVRLDQDVSLNRQPHDVLEVWQAYQVASNRWHEPGGPKGVGESLQ